MGEAVTDAKRHWGSFGDVRSVRHDYMEAGCPEQPGAAAFRAVIGQKRQMTRRSENVVSLTKLA